MMTVRYVAEVQSSFLPFVQQTVTHDVLVTANGYVLQVPGQ
jgi:hypothetical protein